MFALALYGSLYLGGFFVTVFVAALLGDDAEAALSKAMVWPIFVALAPLYVLYVAGAAAHKLISKGKS